MGGGFALLAALGVAPEAFYHDEVFGLLERPLPDLCADRLDYFATQPNAFVVLTDDFVSTEDGTGIVHMAPAFGGDDYKYAICEL